MRGEKELARERKRERERDSGKSYLGRQMGLTVGGKTYKRMNASWVHRTQLPNKQLESPGCSGFETLGNMDFQAQFLFLKLCACELNLRSCMFFSHR